MGGFDLSDEEWAVIAPLLAGAGGRRGRGQTPEKLAVAYKQNRGLA